MTFSSLIRFCCSILVLTLSLNAQTVSPLAAEVMRELQRTTSDDEIATYTERVLRGVSLSETGRSEVESQIRFFFNSPQFLETGGAYLTALFSEPELEEIREVLQNPSLRTDPNFGGVHRLERLFKRLQPYLTTYLKQKTLK